MKKACMILLVVVVEASPCVVDETNPHSSNVVSWEMNNLMPNSATDASSELSSPLLVTFSGVTLGADRGSGTRSPTSGWCSTTGVCMHGKPHRHGVRLSIDGEESMCNRERSKMGNQRSENTYTGGDLLLS
jgi:hypothetical protein